MAQGKGDVAAGPLVIGSRMKVGKVVLRAWALKLTLTETPAWMLSSKSLAKDFVQDAGRHDLNCDVWI